MLGLGDVDRDVADPAELLDRGFRIVERLAVEAVLVLDRLHALALDRLGHDHGRRARRLEGLGVRGVDRLHVVAVDLDRMPAEGLRPLRVRVEIPAVHRLAALAEPVHVDDRDQVVELLVPGMLERLPHRALGHLAVAAQHPDPVREPVEPLARERDAHAVRKALAQRPRGHVDPGQHRSRVPLEPAPELPEREQLLVRDRAGGLVHRVQERRRVPLGEDEVVVARVVRRCRSRT